MKQKSKTGHVLLHGFLDLFFPRNDLFFNEALEYDPERGLYLLHRQVRF